jgi:nitrate/nitrite transporter NarK
MLSNLGGFFGPLLTGLLVQATGTFGAAFMLAGGVGIVAVIGVIIFLSPPRAEPTPAATLATR